MPDTPRDWQAWLAQHGPAALLYARHLTRDAHDAEDALHDGFVRFWWRRGRARDAVALFYACVRSAALDQRRRAVRRRRREAAAAEGMPLFVGPGADDAGRQQAVEAALGRLPVEQREVVILKIWGGLTLAQIAESLGESANTVAARWRYAIEKLQVMAELSHE